MTDDLISRQAVKEWLTRWEGYIDNDTIARMQYRVIDIPSATPHETVTEFADRCRECGARYGKMLKIGHCKDCKYFEYDSVAKVDGIPLIVAHEICSRWGDGCKTKEDGYCFLFEPQESEDKE